MKRAITMTVSKDGKYALAVGPEVKASHQMAAAKSAKVQPGIAFLEVWITGQKPKRFDPKAADEAKAERLAIEESKSKESADAAAALAKQEKKHSPK